MTDFMDKDAVYYSLWTMMLNMIELMDKNAIYDRAYGQRFYLWQI